MNAGCNTWPIFLLTLRNSRRTQSADFLSLNGKTIRTGLSTSEMESWFCPRVALNLAKVKSINFSGYFNFTKTDFSSLHSCLNSSGEKDSRLARPIVVLKSDRFYLLPMWLSQCNPLLVFFLWRQLLRLLSLLMITMPTKGNLLLTAICIVNWIAWCALSKVARKSSAAGEGMGIVNIPPVEIGKLVLIC